MKLEQLEDLAEAARRLQSAIEALDGIKLAARAQVDGRPNGTSPETLLAYHAAWVELSEARTAFVEIPRPVRIELEGPSATNPEGTT